MGLDMYAYKVKASLVGKKQFEVDIDKKVGVPPSPKKDAGEAVKKAYWDYRQSVTEDLVARGIYDREFQYWRKFNHLHGWMEALYRAKGGKAESFNCVNLRLTPLDIAKLRGDAKGLTPTQGFFFGSYEDLTPEDVSEVIAFCDKCDAAFKDGFAIFYDSWW
jgi:hypothetical protein